MLPSGRAAPDSFRAVRHSRGAGHGGFVGGGFVGYRAPPGAARGRLGRGRLGRRRLGAGGSRRSPDAAEPGRAGTRQARGQAHPQKNLPARGARLRRLPPGDGARGRGQRARPQCRAGPARGRGAVPERPPRGRPATPRRGGDGRARRPTELARLCAGRGCAGQRREGRQLQRPLPPPPGRPRRLLPGLSARGHAPGRGPGARLPRRGAGPPVRVAPGTRGLPREPRPGRPRARARDLRGAARGARLPHPRLQGRCGCRRAAGLLHLLGDAGAQDRFRALRRGLGRHERRRDGGGLAGLRGRAEAWRPIRRGAAPGPALFGGRDPAEGRRLRDLRPRPRAPGALHGPQLRPAPHGPGGRAAPLRQRAEARRGGAAHR